MYFLWESDVKVRMCCRTRAQHIGLPLTHAHSQAAQLIAWSLMLNHRQLESSLAGSCSLTSSSGHCLHTHGSLTGSSAHRLLIHAHSLATLFIALTVMSTHRQLSSLLAHSRSLTSSSACCLLTHAFSLSAQLISHSLMLTHSLLQMKSHRRSAHLA